MEYPSYTYPVDALRAGSSLGNLLTFARLTAGTDLQDLWSSRDNEYYLGGWTIEVEVEGTGLEPHETIFRPESQETAFRSGRSDWSIEVSKQFFLPFTAGNNSPGEESPLQAAIFLVRLASLSRTERRAVIRHTLTFPARPCELFTKQPPPDQGTKRVVIERRENSFEVCTEGRPGEARVVGSALVPRGHTSTNESLTIEYEVPVRSEGSVIPFLFAYSPGGIEAARGAYLRCGDADALLAASSAGYASLLSRSEMLTPDPLINRGIQWAKVNTARVQHAYRAGEAFTNDPPQDIVVVRDVAWYVFGSDYVTPEFSHNMLALAASHAFHPDGKLTEFIHADEEVPELHDYRLNINDDTPLCVIALYHHALICDESDALARAYPLMKRACDYILSQTEDGLVRCHSSGTNVWGICGWRNIIEGYNLTGAVTEINAECCRALECTAQAAAHLGKDEEARTYRAASERLRDAVNSKLVSEQTGLYLLSLTDDGTRRHDVTGDLVFPVLFGTADAPMRAKIVARLLRDDIWTPAGARTVSTKEKNYDPDLGLQLLGGVWPNLTAWIAFCCRRDAPARLVEGMRTIYACSEAANPASLVNLVPGEFPERLHGESFESRGMAMSPWMPPTYLWLGVEGLLGAELSAEGLTLNPSLPPGWSWVAVRNLPFRGAGVTAFLYHGELYSNHSVKSSFPLRIGTLIDTRADADSIMCIGLRVDGRILVFAASTRDARGTVSVNDGVRKLSVPVRLGAGDAKLLDVTDVQP